MEMQGTLKAALDKNLGSKAVILLLFYLMFWTVGAKCRIP